MKTFVVTGATQGLGLAIVRALSADGHRVVLAVRNEQKGEEVARTLGANALVRKLDCASLADVRRFAAEWSGHLDGLVNNAGVQATTGTRQTADGYEETIAVNHLAALELTIGLLPSLSRGGRVVFIGSGTHSPENPSAVRFGFRGARYTSLEALARGDSDAPDEGQRNRDRYATSKFLNTVSGIELARRIPAGRTAFFTVDPGLMAGTGLARDQPGYRRFLWSYVLPVLSKLMPDTSTPPRSAAAVAWVLTDPALAARSGAVLSFDRKPSRFLWSEAERPEVGRRVIDESLALLGHSAAALRDG